MSLPLIGFAGMTHLGLISAVAAAERGFPVVGFDPDPRRILPLTYGELPVVEPDLPDLIIKNRLQLLFTSMTADLACCDVVYIAADVPTDDDGSSDLQAIYALIDLVEGALKPEAVLVVLSQVPPGFTRGLSRLSAQRFYQVETLIFGRAIERALYPERFILGCADPTAALPKSLADFLSAFGCPILPMRYESAELAKISVNMCLVASISTTNTLAELCEKIGADWVEIVPALKLDKRIGQYAYLAPGLGIGGGHIERDLVTFCRLADAHGTDAGVVHSWIANSQHRRDWALAQVHEFVLRQKPNPVLAVLGLAYKQDTDSTKNSPALALLSALRPFIVRVYDPVVAPRPEFHPRLVGTASALDACDGADALVIMTPWSAFRALSPAALAVRLRGQIVIDPYGVLDARACRAAGLRHLILGAPPGEVATYGGGRSC
jgi:UDPglucose 6-dehydrogenase